MTFTVLESDVRRAWTALAAYLVRQTALGRLDVAAPDLAALQFKGLLEAGLVEPRLYGVPPLFDPDTVVAAAVAMFLAYHGPGPVSPEEE